MNVKDSVGQIIEYLGGSKNIVTVTNCMTRLRIVTKDETLVDEAKLKEMVDVLGLVHDRNCSYEIVVGPGKSRKYADICHEMGLAAVAENAAGNVAENAAGNAAENVAGNAGNDWKQNKEKIKAGQKKNKLKEWLKVIGDIFIPLIPGVIAAGLCAGIASIISQVVPNYADIPAWNIVYTLLTLVSTSVTTYFTAWCGYRAAERFGATPILGGMLGLITSLDGINTIAKTIGLFDDAQPLQSILRVGRGGVLAVIVGVFILSFVEKKIRKIMPDSVDIVFTPLLSLIIVLVPYILIVMPLLGLVSSGIVWVFGQACMSGSWVVRIITGYVSATLFLPLVAAGMHHGLVALYSVQLQEIGFITLYPALAMAGAGQVGAALAIMKKAKQKNNKRLVSVIRGALPAGFLGVGEPLIYGVTLPMGKPFITAGLGAGFGGAFVMLMQVASTTWGPSGLLGIFVMTKGPNTPIVSIIYYLIGLAISYVMSFIITNIFVKLDDAQVKHGDLISFSDDKKKADSQIFAPADGKLVPMNEIPDPVFSTGQLGKCVGIIPDNGNIYSPCDGTIVTVIETKHAVTISSDDGKDYLLHVGIDTVKLGGKGFNVLVNEGEHVSKSQKIMETDLDIIKESGYSTMVISVML